jgi:hypothetical protein
MTLSLIIRFVVYWASAMFGGGFCGLAAAELTRWYTKRTWVYVGAGLLVSAIFTLCWFTAVGIWEP